jgi:hypothetical protein
MEKNAASEAALIRVAIEGLIALNYGEARGMFEPSGKKGSHDGTRPYTIRKLKMQALGFGDLLIAKKYTPAIKTVADAYGETAENIAAWRKDKRLAKTTDPLMKSFREGIAKLEWDEAQILERLKRAGATYRTEKKIACKNKK